MSGEVIDIHITTEAGGAPVHVDRVNAVAGRGLEGDRYFNHTGTYSETPGSGREVTLIAMEEIETLEREHGIQLAPGESRRNITTRGVSLNDLVDREFRVGEVTLRGTRLCEPCDYLQKTIGKDGVLKGLVHRAGLRCDIVKGGAISVGDSVETQA
jgi:MOSC domain-containing protein YiiM